jgi:hypothetical protein
LRTDNPEVTDEMIDQLIKQVDLNNNGKISFEDFVIMLRLHENLKSSRASLYNGNGIPDSIMSHSPCSNFPDS